MNYLLAKQDLQYWTPRDLETLATHFKVHNANRNELLWLLAINIHSGNNSRAEMPKTKKTFFDKTLKYDWDMKTIDRSLDLSRVETYLSLVDEPHRSFIEEVIKNTRYIPFDVFKEALVYSFDLFKKRIGVEKFYILLDDEKIGSEHWIVALLWRYIKELNVVEIIHSESEIPKNANILLIDDAIYSGHHLTQIFGDLGENITIHVVVPYISNIGYEYLISFCKSRGLTCNFYYKELIDSIRTSVDILKYYPAENTNIYKYSPYYPRELYYSLYNMQIFSPRLSTEKGILYNAYKINAFDVTPIYFDHKVAGSSSTLLPIYMKGIIPFKDNNYGSLLKQAPSRHQIERLEALAKSQL